jgi:hypothetical protein
MDFVEGKVLRDHFQISKVFYLRDIRERGRSRESFEKGHGELGFLLPERKLCMSQGYLVFVSSE